MQRKFGIPFLLAIIGALCSVPAHAGKIALLLEEPYGQFGSMNPTGHAAIYLSDVCAETPVLLRRCGPGEAGVVISRYHRVDGYDWLAVPLLPYLYAVDSSDEIPEDASRGMVMRIRDEYRRRHLLHFVPDDPHGEIPNGEWTELLGESYDRKIYGFALETTPEQDNELIELLNDHRNRSHFNLLFNNCANFAEKILNFYFPHSVHRNFIADAGIMTPKQVAHSLTKYAKRHTDLEFTTFVIPQIRGSIRRSTPVHGVLEALLETKKYALPLAILHPEIAGGLLAVYFGDGRFHPAAQMDGVFDPRQEREPGMTATQDADSSKSPEKTAAVTEADYQQAEGHPAE